MRKGKQQEPPSVDEAMEEIRKMADEYPEIGAPVLSALESMRARHASRRRTGIVAALILMALLAWFFRWEVQPLQGRTGAYVLDRWTGDIFILDGDERLLVVPAKPVGK
ncbi:MAG: hypothetical protein HY854_08405 [Burkholderiales bacterium]|nr:hypothetical protein [Burkholderiales bacterium]